MAQAALARAPVRAEDDVPVWLSVMRAITGLTETPGSADNPNILKMRDAVAAAYPDMADYAALYQHDETAWCGLTMAFVMTKAGIRPVFGTTDTDRWMWARAWAEGDDASNFGTVLDVPRPGCIVVMEREGGGHVTLYERTEGSNYVCRGGNQSDMVNESSYSMGSVIALIWPKAGGPVPPAERRELSRGDSGPDVMSVQRSLGLLPDDGDFGPVTEAGVEQLQRAFAVAGGADGVVGPATWSALDDLDASMAAGDDGISDALAAQIDDIADRSPLRDYSWPDRGRAPPGYYAGMGKAFALAATRFEAEDDAAEIMAQADTGNEDKDALAWYADEFDAEDMDNSETGLDTLRHLFVLMVGLGMRESSGNHWEGRDMSADNVSSDTAEAGLFQSSWNLSSCASEIEDLLDEYKADPNGFRPTFTEGLSPTSSNLDSYGSGDGALYQFLAKYSPAFAVLMSAVGLRKLRQHWGPINRKEVDIVPAVDDFLREVQAAFEGEAPQPPLPVPAPRVNIAVSVTGDVDVTINRDQASGAPPAVDIAIAEIGDVSVTVTHDEEPQRTARPWRAS